VSHYDKTDISVCQQWILESMTILNDDTLSR